MIIAVFILNELWKIFFSFDSNSFHFVVCWSQIIKIKAQLKWLSHLIIKNNFSKLWKWQLSLLSFIMVCEWFSPFIFPLEKAITNQFILNIILKICNIVCQTWLDLLNLWRARPSYSTRVLRKRGVNRVPTKIVTLPLVDPMNLPYKALKDHNILPHLHIWSSWGIMIVS